MTISRRLTWAFARSLALACAFEGVSARADVLQEIFTESGDHVWGVQDIAVVDNELWVATRSGIYRRKSSSQNLTLETQDDFSEIFPLPPYLFALKNGGLWRCVAEKCGQEGWSPIDLGTVERQPAEAKSGALVKEVLWVGASSGLWKITKDGHRRAWLDAVPSAIEQVVGVETGDYIFFRTSRSQLFSLKIGESPRLIETGGRAIIGLGVLGRDLIVAFTLPDPKKIGSDRWPILDCAVVTPGEVCWLAIDENCLNSDSGLDAGLKQREPKTARKSRWAKIRALSWRGNNYIFSPCGTLKNDNKDKRWRAFDPARQGIVLDGIVDASGDQEELIFITRSRSYRQAAAEKAPAATPPEPGLACPDEPIDNLAAIRTAGGELLVYGKNGLYSIHRNSEAVPVFDSFLGIRLLGNLHFTMGPTLAVADLQYRMANEKALRSCERCAPKGKVVQAVVDLDECNFQPLGDASGSDFLLPSRFKAQARDTLGNVGRSEGIVVPIPSIVGLFTLVMLLAKRRSVQLFFARWSRNVARYIGGSLAKAEKDGASLWAAKKAQRKTRWLLRQMGPRQAEGVESSNGEELLESGLDEICAMLNRNERVLARIESGLSSKLLRFFLKPTRSQKGMLRVLPSFAPFVVRVKALSAGLPEDDARELLRRVISLHVGVESPVASDYLLLQVTPLLLVLDYSGTAVEQEAIAKGVEKLQGRAMWLVLSQLNTAALDTFVEWKP